MANRYDERSRRRHIDQRHRRVWSDYNDAGDEYVSRAPDAVTPSAPNAGDRFWTSDFANGRQFGPDAFEAGYRGPRLRDMNYAQGDYGSANDLSWPYATGGMPQPGDRENWTTRGPHTGRGPAGYRRSDERILEDVCERLTQHGWIDATNIEIDVEEGVVNLRGRVDSWRTKRLAEDAAGSARGIHDVMNYLTIRREDED